MTATFGLSKLQTWRWRKYLVVAALTLAMLGGTLAQADEAGAAAAGYYWYQINGWHCQAYWNGASSSGPYGCGYYSGDYFFYQSYTDGHWHTSDVTSSVITTLNGILQQTQQNRAAYLRQLDNHRAGGTSVALDLYDNMGR